MNSASVIIDTRVAETLITNQRLSSMFQRIALSGNSLYDKISPDSNNSWNEIFKMLSIIYYK